MLRLCAFSLLATVLYGAVNLVAAENDRDAQLAAACTPCHRLDGADQGIPPIAGMDAGKLIAMIDAFRSTARPSHIMHTVSISLSDDEIASVARYFATRRK